MEPTQEDIDEAIVSFNKMTTALENLVERLGRNDNMKTYDLANRPEGLVLMRKTAMIQAVYLTDPFVVNTQEGPMTISPHTVDDWLLGYYIAYPSDGSKPYSISPAFMRDNYTEAT